MGIIGKSIITNYRYALQIGDIAQAQEAARLANQLENLIRQGFKDYSEPRLPDDQNSGHLKPIPYKYFDDSGAVVLGDKTFYLTDAEKLVFEYFANNASSTSKIKIISVKKIIQNVWGNKNVTPDAVRVAIHRLRQKLEKDHLNPELIISVYGKGYVFWGERITTA